MTDAIVALKHVTCAIHPLPADVLSAFCSCFHPGSAGRQQVLTATGNKENYLYFIYEGVQRVYYTTESGREATILFTYPHSFGGVLDSFMLQQPSRYHYEAMTPSSFLRASFYDIQETGRRHPAIETMLRKGLSLALSGVLERLAEIQVLSAEEKLRTLFRRSPHIFQMIPQKYLASYIGIDATNFSKFMNAVRL